MSGDSLSDWLGFIADKHGFSGSGGEGGAPAEPSGAEGSDAGEETRAPTHSDELWAKVEARQAAEDAPVDEYGLKKPHVPYTVRLPDEVAPPEIMNDPEIS